MAPQRALCSFLCNISTFYSGDPEAIRSHFEDNGYGCSCILLTQKSAHLCWLWLWLICLPLGCWSLASQDDAPSARGLAKGGLLATGLLRLKSCLSRTLTLLVNMAGMPSLVVPPDEVLVLRWLRWPMAARGVESLVC